jgi:hypothetical protein
MKKMIKEIKMRFKTKIVILLAAVLLTTSGMTEAENEPSKGCC